MKASVYHNYGSPDVLHLEDVDRPAPKDDEVLIEVHAASVNSADWRLLRASPWFLRLMGPGLLKPKNKILGTAMTGRVEAVGGKVRKFRPGDEVFGDLSNCGRGGFAEYVSVPESELGLKPANSSFAEAAAVPEAALVALQGLRDKGRIQKGQKVLICGASGGIGTFAVQIAKYFGAEVTGVCGATNLDLVRSLGADHVIDYAKEDFTRNGQLYDLILAVRGYHSIFAYKRALSPKGIYVMTGGSWAQIFQALFIGPWISMAGSRKLGALTVKPNQDLALMKELIEAGKVKPVIDRRYPLGETAEAFRYFAEGHARGKVVITVA
ncbi:MAG: NAD(P)-dependent alcohol dehydrogenase [Candidatus Aminicenantes bacterium]|nr:NAD(P)-dependent alcohol dehydrogenase [Candidatus Aminicenantes bacterium]